MSTQEAAEAQLIYQPHTLSNTNTLANVRFLTSCFVGAIAGVLGLENWLGFALFGFASLTTAVVIYLIHVAGRSPAGAASRATKKSPVQSYVRGGVWEMVNPGQENLFSFVLLWTLFYGVVHVYD